MIRELLYGPDFCAVLEDGRLVEYLSIDSKEQSGDVLIGKVDRMLPALSCAFCNIGRKKSGFLPLDEESKTFSGKSVHSGEIMIPQIRKEENGEKGAFLTRDITLPGQYIILMPLNRYIGVSNRIKDESERDRMKECGRRIAKERFGLVMRRTSVAVEEAEIREEAEQLYRIWQQIIIKARETSIPGTVLHHSDIEKQLAEDYQGRGITRTRRVSHLDPELRKQLLTVSQRVIPLKHGGNIIIDRCEAMTVIDVNTSSVRGTADKEYTVTETNLEACRTISDQIRLRNLGGIILIDFIDMEEEKDRSLVCDRLMKCFEDDRIKTVIHGWTRLGLMEMTRKRCRSETRLT